MADFCLRIAAHNIHIFSQSKPLFELLVITESLDGIREHAAVKSERRLAKVGPDPVVVLLESLALAIAEVELSVFVP